MTVSPLDFLDRIASAGYSSAKLDEANKMSALVEGKEAVWMTHVQFKEKLIQYAVKKGLQKYKSDHVVAVFLSFMFCRVIQTSTPLTEIANHASKYPPSDFGIENLDDLASLIADVLQVNIDGKTFHPCMTTIVGWDDWLDSNEDSIDKILHRIERIGGSVLPPSLVDAVKAAHHH